MEDQRRFGRGGGVARCDCCKGFDHEVLGEVGVGDRVPEGDVESADQRVRLVGGREIGEIRARAAVEFTNLPVSGFPRAEIEKRPFGKIVIPDDRGHPMEHRLRRPSLCVDPGNLSSKLGVRLAVNP